MMGGKLEERLRLGEDSTTEFKSVIRSGYLADAKAIARTVAAFANSGGGTILLGVEDDGTPSGVGTMKQADVLMRQVTQVCADAVRPAISCPVNKAEAAGVTVLAVEVPGFGVGRPYRVAGVPFIRDANRTREATNDELRRLVESADHHFDEQEVEGSSTDDLDPVAAADFLRSAYVEAEAAENRDRYLVELRCLDRSGTATVAGILLFGRDVSRWMLDARISAARFAGTEISGDLADRKEIQGRLAVQIEQTIGFLAAQVSDPARVEGVERRDGGIPVPVLREAVVNAVSHRDYRAASQIRLFVFDDRVEVINPGGLLNRLTLDGIRLGGISQRRNPVVASLLARMARRENIGLGVPEMLRLMREHGLPEPEFDLSAGHFPVVLRRR